MIDNRAGAHAAISHLLDLGHRRIAYVTGRREVSTVWERLAGYHDALAESRHRARPAADLPRRDRSGGGRRGDACTAGPPLPPDRDLHLQRPDGRRRTGRHPRGRPARPRGYLAGGPRRHPLRPVPAGSADHRRPADPRDGRDGRPDCWSTACAATTSRRAGSSCSRGWSCGRPPLRRPCRPCMEVAR